MPLAHGNYSLTVKDNIIHLTVSGPFNAEGANEWITKIKDIIRGFGDETFCILANSVNIEGATPEAFSAVNEYNQWLNEQNLLAKAIVVNNGIFKNMELQRLPSRASQTIQYFDNDDDALCWLQTFK